jgi:hypothetical protein
MSKPRTIWTIIWERAARDPSPFEISEMVPQVAAALGVDARDAEKRIAMLLKELSRMPEGEQYFTREGNAVVALPEFQRSPKDAATAAKAYPFEL